jgi:predicted metal-dependent phosphoesterase TrpH
MNKAYGGGIGMKRVELHTHSTWSDGSVAAAEIVRLAKLAGLDAVSVTDHDTMEGQEEALEEGMRQSIPVVSGVEISCWDPADKKKIHILGYCVKDQQMVTDNCRKILDERDRKNKESLELVRKAGYNIDLNDCSRYEGKNQILYRQHIMNALVDKGYSQGIFGDVFNSLFGKGGAAVVKYDYMPVKEGVRLIKEAGGYAVLAHPFHYHSMDKVPDLVSWGLDGIECWHYSQTPEMSEEVKDVAQKLGLFLTGGTDWHGFYCKASVPLGWIRVMLPEDHELLTGLAWS